MWYRTLLAKIKNIIICCIEESIIDKGEVPFRQDLIQKAILSRCKLKFERA